MLKVKNEKMFEDFLTSKITIATPIKEQAEKLLNHLNFLNFKWSSGENLKKFSNWETFRTITVYSIENSAVVFGSKHSNDWIDFTDIFEEIEIDFMDLLFNNIKTNNKGENNMKKSDLQTGTVVKTRNGELNLLLVNEKNEMMLVDSQGYLKLSDFKEDLTFEDVEQSEFDIIEVYKIKNILDLDSLFTENNLTLIWKREDVDWSEVEVDTPILVSDEKEKVFYKRYFCKYENGKVYAFLDGENSKTTTLNMHWASTKLF